MRALDTIEDAIKDLKLGKMIIVVDDEDRENEGDFVMAAEMITPEAVNFMATHGRGMICAPITTSIAKKLDLPLQTANHSAPLGTAFTVTIDAANHVSTGISASDRAHTLKLMTDENARPTDFTRPGHIFPLIARDGGVLVRNGHTEASVDLARIAGFAPVGVICEIMNADGSMSRRDDLEVIAQTHGLKLISIADLIRWRKHHENLISEFESVPMPSKLGTFALHVFKSETLKQEAMAIVKGDPKLLKNNTALLRVHSECFTGDVLGSQRCDCGEQLNRALTRIEEEGSGIVIYLRQEGRGIGLTEKLKAYLLQNEGLDTVDANLQLGHQVDARDWSEAIAILKNLGVSAIKLLTNNPEKVKAVADSGISCEQLSLSVEPNEFNKKYLATKAERLGHTTPQQSGGK